MYGQTVNVEPNLGNASGSGKNLCFCWSMQFDRCRYTGAILVNHSAEEMCRQRHIWSGGHISEVSAERNLQMPLDDASVETLCHSSDRSCYLSKPGQEEDSSVKYRSAEGTKRHLASGTGCTMYCWTVTNWANQGQSRLLTFITGLDTHAFTYAII